ncbi:hypothetical protein ASZ78_008601 [Callipepla squamata]|uniref:Calponin-homology (CH) domain-containing protein n=1 Tax=Callipepla squamata TaxID=9009 RepID=A0A226NEJ4_CALSU|nr:hypothetical protein ASZ78_008601 [Callipepla squamata]
MAEQSNIQSAASKSIRPFRSSEEYLDAMKEDLAEWFNALYDLDMAADTFLEALATGCDLCQHANNVNRVALEFQQRHPEAAARVPRNEVIFQARNVAPGSFVARDNVSNFIRWCRQDLGIQDVLMFETNDLVLKKNEKNVVLCLLEVARRGSKFGMLAPMLIQMEEEIEEELRDQTCGALGAPRGGRALRPESPAYPGQAQRVSLCDLRNLDELVRGTRGPAGEGLHGCPVRREGSVQQAGSCAGDPGLLYVPIPVPHGENLRGQGRPGAEPVLLIRRGRDGQHSWARADGGAPGARRSSLPGAADADAFQEELEALARRLRAPLRLEPGQEQQLLGRLEEEFLANTRLMELGDAEPSPPARPAHGVLEPGSGAAADSAYCSSSSSSSSLNVLGNKHGALPEDGRRNGGPPAAPHPQERCGRPSSSSDESSCVPASGAESDPEWALLVEDEGPEAAAVLGVPASPALRPRARPRLDAQPGRKPTRIPAPRPPASPQPWRALHNVLASLLEPGRAPREDEGLREDAWP